MNSDAEFRRPGAAERPAGPAPGDASPPAFTPSTPATAESPTDAAPATAGAPRPDRETLHARLLERLGSRGEDCRGVFLGDFLVGREVGRGGYGAVHVGWELVTGRKVAVKILHAGMSLSADARFGREAEFLSRFDHPNIVGFIGSGRAEWRLPPAGGPAPQDEWFQGFRGTSEKTYLVLHWIDGRTLEQAYQAGVAAPASRPSTRATAEWFAQAAGALTAVHARGLVHRDVKPSNLMIDGDGAVKVMDFGISRSRDADGALQTPTGVALGTPEYMAPEQLAAADPDRAANPAGDVYSLCAAFYELFTHTRLFDHDKVGRTAVGFRKMQGERPQRPRERAPELPWEIDAILAGGLEPNPADRYRSMDALESDLRRFLEYRPILYKRPSLRRRIALACLRNPLAAVLSVVFAVAAVVGSVSYVVSINNEQRRTSAERDRADDERRKAQEHAESARKSADEARRRLAESYVERGRQELLDGRAGRAAAYLNEARRLGEQGPVLRFLLAEALAAVPTEQVRSRGHTKGVYGAEYSPDGSRIVTASRDRTAKVWDARDGTLLRDLSGVHTRELNAAVFSPDGKRIVTAGDDGVIAVWEAESGRLLKKCCAHSGKKIYSPTFSPQDGALLATAGEDGTAEIRDSRTLELRHALLHEPTPGEARGVVRAAFSPFGERLVTAGGRSARIWDVPTGRLVSTVPADADGVNWAGFTPDGKQIVTVGNNAIAKLWSADPGKDSLRTTMFGHKGAIRRGAISRNGTLVATASADGTARIWNIFDLGGVQPRMIGDGVGPAPVVLVHGGPLFSVSFNRDVRPTLAATAGRDGAARIWDAATGKKSAELIGHKGGVYSAVFAPDFSPGAPWIVTAGEDGTARVWNALTGEPRFTLDGLSRPGPDPESRRRLRTYFMLDLADAVFSPDGRRVLLTGTQPRQYDLSRDEAEARRDAEFILTLKLSTGRYRDDGFAVLGGGDGDGRVYFWNIAEGTDAKFEPPAGRSSVHAIAVSPDGTRIAAACADGAAWIWDFRSAPTPLVKLPEPVALKHGHAVNSVEFSPDGRLVLTSSGDCTAGVWSAETGAQKFRVEHPTQFVNRAVFSPDGRLFATASNDETAAIWNVADASRRHRLAGHRDWVVSVSFSADGRRIVTAGRDGRAKIWSVRDGVELVSLDGHSGPVVAAEFSPDPAGEFVVTASRDGTARLWEAAAGRVLAAYRHKKDVVAARFSRDGDMILTVGEDNKVHVWDVRPETRSAPDVDAWVRRHVPWKLEGESLRPTAAPEPKPWNGGSKGGAATGSDR